MPKKLGATKKYKLLHWVRNLDQGEQVDADSALYHSGVCLGRDAVHAALAEFAANGLLDKVGRGKYTRSGWC